MGPRARGVVPFGKAARGGGRGGRALVALRAALGGPCALGVWQFWRVRRRSTQEKLRVAEALEELPATTHALESGALGWSAVRELTRVVVAETEQQWLEAAAGKTVRQLEQLVEGKSPGDDPSDSPAASERRHVLRFEVAPETFALFREAMTALRRRTGSMLDDDSALLLMAREVLGGPQDVGRASYQIALNVCAACGSSAQQAAGELVPVGAHVVEMARCDGQQLGYWPPRLRTRTLVRKVSRRADVRRQKDKASTAIRVQTSVAVTAPSRGAWRPTPTMTERAPTWAWRAREMSKAPAQSKRFHPPYAERCSDVIMNAAK